MAEAKAPSSLTPEAVALLLTLLEQREPLLSGAAAAMCEEETALLAAAGLLVPHDYEDAAARPGDDEDVPVPLFWSDALGGLAAFSPTAGPVLVPAEQLVRRRVDVSAVLMGMAATLDLPAGWQQHQRVHGLVWELGEMRLGSRPQRHSLWFARRLGDRSVQQQVQDAIAARPHPRLRVLLTSSRGERLDGLALPGTSAVPLRDVLATHDALTVSGEVLGARITGVVPLDQGEPIHLSEDGSTLVLLGGEPIYFRSAEQIAVIRKLVAARQAGKRFRAQDLTDHGTLRRLFGKEKWARLSPYLASVAGRWGFNV